MRACPNCGEDAPEGARFCPGCGMELASAPAAPQEVRKVVTVVFCDLTGSTSLGERLDPESVRQMIRRYFDAMRAALESHGGTVEKFIGDAVMAVFGVPVVREDDAIRAVRAAADMRAALGQLNEELESRFGVQLRVRTGVNTGEVIAGDPSAGHGFVTGDTVNVAARFEQAAGPGEILIGRETCELVRDVAQVEPVEPLDLKGKSEPVPAFRLMDVVEAGARGPAPSGEPFVGREAELGALREAFDAAVDGETGRLLTVLGPAGIGKSRLAGEFAESVQGEGRTVTGRCLSYGEGLTFWPLRGVVEQLAGIDGSESADEVRAKVAELFPEDDDKATAVERVLGAIGVGDGAAYPTETAWAVRKLVEAASAEQPLVIVFEDLHWAEPTFLELLKYLAATVQNSAVLIVAVARTELLDTAPDFAAGLPNARRIELDPLGPGESRALAEQLIGDDRAGLADRVVAAGGGNPLFVEELARTLGEGPAEQAPSVPPTIHALLAARIDRLDPTERAVVEAAAVAGGTFADDALLELGCAADAAELETRLGALVHKDLIQPEDGRFASRRTHSFKHGLIRDVAYRGMLKETRADLHARFADWLEQAAGERASEYEELLGYHLERAYTFLSELAPLDQRGRDLAERAAARLGSSGRRALARGDIQPAASLLDRAVSLLPEDDPARRDLTLKLGLALAETGQMTRADGLLHDRIEAERRDRTLLVFHDATGCQHVVELDEEQPAVTIGRRKENDLALSWDRDVSRSHAELRRTPQGWLLVDEGSSNGSYVNGERVSGEHPLHGGDVMRFGDTVVLFRAPTGDEGASQPSQVSSMGQSPTRFRG